jgi:hypothetical protein
MQNDSLKDPVDINISDTIDPADYNIKDPFDQNIKDYLVENYNFTQCPLGKPELDNFCMSAYKNKEGILVCMNMYGWTNHMQVEGLKKCYQDMEYKNKLAEANRRRKGNFKGSNYPKRK